VVCQGSNSVGQLGNNSTNTGNVTMPVAVVAGSGALSGITRVFLDTQSAQLACAINGSGAAWCWGHNDVGELGNGGTSNSLSAYPVLTSGTEASPGPQLTGVSKMAVTQDHVCALKTDGTVWCWGANNYGQIGTGSASPTQYDNPAQVSGITNAVDIATALDISCAITSDTTLWCWGENDDGQLNLGKTDGNAHPTPVHIMAQPDAGGPLTGISAVAIFGGTDISDGAGVLVLQNSPFAGYPNTLSMWGSGTTYHQVSHNSTQVSGVYELCPQDSYATYSYIDSTGELIWVAPYAPTLQMPSCP
jgi:alpha-tubulin suppressor-like RCC1 family protein